MERIVIVGAPDSGKRKLAYRLRKFGVDTDYRFAPYLKSGRFAVGTEADYRTEIKIAVDRCFLDEPKKTTVYIHSLVDSVVYAAIRAEKHSNMESVQQYTREKSALTLALTTVLLRDTFRADHVFLIRTDDEDKVQWEEMAATVLTEFGIDYEILAGNPKEWTDEVAKVINGQREATSESAIS